MKDTLTIQVLKCLYEKKIVGKSDQILKTTKQILRIRLFILFF